MHKYGLSILLLVWSGAGAYAASDVATVDLASTEAPAAEAKPMHDLDETSELSRMSALAADRPVSGQPIPEISGINVTREEINKWHKYFDLVIVVNKASSAQTLQVFKKDVAEPILNTRVSTGTEEYRCHAVRDRATGNAIKVKKIFTQTPTGYYVAGRADIDHFSGAYDDAHMPFAVFMKDPTGAADGIATHKAPGADAEALIGNRESHACMRMHLKDSQEVFKDVLLTGGPIDIDKDDGLRAQCNPALDQSLCPADVANRSQGYRKWLLGSGVIGKTYPTRQTVPVVNRDGTLSDGQGHSFKLDEVNGREKRVQGYKTLYIIQDVETGKPTGDRIAKKVGKGGKVLASRAAQKKDFTCPTADEVNEREGRTNVTPVGWAQPGQRQQPPQQQFCLPFDWDCARRNSGWH